MAEEDKELFVVEWHLDGFESGANMLPSDSCQAMVAILDPPQS